MTVNTRESGAYALLKRHMSEPRLRHYVAACQGDAERAVELYQWNTRLAAALWADISHFEVPFRNAIDARLTGRHIRLKRPGLWLDDPAGELGRDRHGSGRHAQPYKDIHTARSRVMITGMPMTHGQIVSETGFGLWHQLISKRHTNLWPDIAAAFPHAPNRSRAAVADLVTRIRDLRNRVGHHHRVFARDCLAERDRILRVAGYVSRDLAQWIEAQSMVAITMAARP